MAALFLAIPHDLTDVRAERAAPNPPPALRLTAPSHAVTALDCSTCHKDAGDVVGEPSHPLNARVDIGQSEWADAVQLDAKCGTCHLVPDPSVLPPDRWRDAIMNYMSKVIYYRQEASGFRIQPMDVAYRDWMAQTRDDWMDVMHYYFAFSSPERSLPKDPAVSTRLFESEAIGDPATPGKRPQVGNVNIVDVDADGRVDVLVGDFERHQVTLLRNDEGRWTERALAAIPYPGHTEVGDFDGDGQTDIIVANVGSSVPTDDLVGSVILLTREEGIRFKPTTILDGVGRVADVRPGDFDQDGDVDFVVAVFGFLKVGEIGWLERNDDGRYSYHLLSKKQGGVNVIPTDLNEDGRLDFIALVSQQHEEVVAFINETAGRFSEQILFKANSPTFGSSGIELADLDRDGDDDILYTNGDGFDLSSPMYRPYHGVQWLENQGEYDFVYHDLLRLYGAYRAVPGDLDDDGDTDIIATSLLSDWSDPERMSILWLENDGRQHFSPHGIGNTPASIISAEIADVDGDGRLDVVTGSMSMSRSDRSKGRVTLWSNLGPPE